LTEPATSGREYARNDPRGFLAEYGDGAVIDEIQNVPELLAYIQADVDDVFRGGYPLAIRCDGEEDGSGVSSSPRHVSGLSTVPP
jgi:hypothetical protein